MIGRVAPALPAAALAAACALGARLAGWRGGDAPAQLYRVELFRTHGFTVFDSQWFAGHWVPDYSVVFPAVAATLGVTVTVVCSAAVAAGCFDRLVAGRLPAPRAASVVFAACVVVVVAIGQFDFLAGEAVGLATLVAMAARRWAPAVLLALLTALVAPLAAAFVAVSAAAVWLRPRTGGRRGPAAVAAAAVVPVALSAALFPGGGFMPFPFVDWFWEAVIGTGAAVAAGRRLPVLRIGLVLYVAVLTLAFAVHSPLGGNAGRAGDVAALPLAFGLWWGRRRLRLAAVVVPLALMEWTPAWRPITALPASRWTSAPAFAPLVAAVVDRAGPAGRVEVVPTATHYETSSVAPGLALTRGWERQLDEVDDPLFYGRAPLTPVTYLAWLRATGTRWVALADAPLDEAGVAEARLLRAGVAGLTPVWSADGWRLWAVDGSSGIAPAGLAVARAEGGRVDLVADQPGTYRLAERTFARWTVTDGAATVASGPGGWLVLRVASPGPVGLEVSWP